MFDPKHERIGRPFGERSRGKTPGGQRNPRGRTSGESPSDTREPKTTPRSRRRKPAKPATPPVATAIKVAAVAMFIFVAMAVLMFKAAVPSEYEPVQKQSRPMRTIQSTTPNQSIQRRRILEQQARSLAQDIDVIERMPFQTPAHHIAAVESLSTVISLAQTDLPKYRLLQGETSRSFDVYLQTGNITYLKSGITRMQRSIRAREFSDPAYQPIRQSLGRLLKTWQAKAR